MFFQPRYIKRSKDLIHGARKLLRYRRDLLPQDTLDQVNSMIGDLKNAVSARDKDAAEKAAKQLDDACMGILPPYKHREFRDNVEVFLVAIVIAAGIKAYFLQPFKIPTGSMQPTLNGVIGYPQEEQAPNFLVQGWQSIWNGRNYIDLVSQTDGNQVEQLKEYQRFHFFTFTDVVCKDGTYTLMAPAATLVRYFDITPPRPLIDQFGSIVRDPQGKVVYNRKTYNKGDVIARGYIDTGDQVFVDKMSYHFFPPKRSDVFVFKTTGIRKIEATQNPAMGSQFYIKRLAGLPGDTLQINPPELLINGELPAQPGLARVISEENGYRGYSNQSAQGGSFDFLGNPQATFSVPTNSYFALGDNSFYSSDSRYWGTVPEKNLVGRGLVVYWPFGQHFGLID